MSDNKQLKEQLRDKSLGRVDREVTRIEAADTIERLEAEVEAAAAQVLAEVRERLLSDEFLDAVGSAVIREPAQGLLSARREAISNAVQGFLATLNPKEGQ